MAGMARRILATAVVAADSAGAKVPSQGEFTGLFAMKEKAAEGFLNALSAIIRNGRDNPPEPLELPRFDPAGFGFGDDAADLRSPASEYRHAFYRDGLAQLGSRQPCRIARRWMWLPKEGLRVH